MVVVFATISMAQEKKEVYKDIVYLTNGSILKGQLLDYKVGGIVKLKLENGSILTINDDVVKRINMYSGKSSVDDLGYDFDMPYEMKEHGIIYSFAFNIMLGQSDAIYYYYRYYYGLNRTAYGGNLSIAYRFKPAFSLGGGIGVTTYGYGLDEFIFPLYVEATSNFLSGRYSPFLKLKMGYGFVIATSKNVLDSSGGLYMNPVFGIKIGTSSNMDFTFGIGLNYQKAFFKHGYYDEKKDVVLAPIHFQDIKFKRLSLNIGITF